ncbi:MAG: DUF4373 domain-containing protein [Eubacterium sp.]|nr:DUF4373 domain-containing protein [Eubacterium sp.]
MPRPRKVGLDYFPEDVGRRNDFKIMDLLNEYGPLGYVIYDFCLQYIYENGYYIDAPLSQVALLLIKDIGAKWIKQPYRRGAKLLLYFKSKRKRKNRRSCIEMR